MMEKDKIYQKRSLVLFDHLENYNVVCDYLPLTSWKSPVGISGLSYLHFKQICSHYGGLDIFS